MKIRNIFGILGMAVYAAMAVTACDPEMTPTDEEVVFPELQRFHDMKPGDIVELSFTADAQWTISIPDSCLNDFWIQDGTFELDSKSGAASQEPITINIAVASSESFGDRYCEVTMTMGGKSAVIAELLCPGKERTVSLFACNVEDDTFMFDEDGKYAYSTEEASEVALLWSGSDFRLPVRVSANYNWTVEFPSWARADLADTRTGTTEFNIYAIPSEYPLDPAEGMIKFKSGDKVIKEYKITIPGCRDIYSYGLDMGLSELEFNYIGQYKVPTGYLEAPATGSITGVDGATVFAAEINADGLYTGEEAEWVVLEVSDYDASEGADVLQNRTISITVLPNEGENRYATLLLLPPVEGEYSSLFTADMSAIGEDYSQYAFSVCQTALPDDYLTPQSDAETMASVGASFEKAEEDWLFSAFATNYAYKLTYAESWSRDESFMYLTTSFASYDVYDYDCNKIPSDSLANHWLSFTALEGNMVGVVDMNSDLIETETAEGFIVFRDNAGNALAVVWCIFDPNSGGNETGGEVAFIGESVLYAPMVGATLEFCPDGKVDGTNYRQSEELVYHLKYTMTGMPMRISVPNAAVAHTVNPYLFRESIKINNILYEEIVNGRVGGFELIDGGIDIYMSMPEGRSYMRGNIIFTDKAGNFVLTIVCTLDLTGDAQ